MKRFAALIWTAVLLLSISFSLIPHSDIYAASPSRRTVRAGFFESEGYAYMDLNGSFRGYDIELLEEIGAYGNMNIEVSVLSSVSEAESMLAGGSIDVLVDFLKTPEREEKFIFSENPVVTEASCIFVRADETRYKRDDLQAVARMRIGCASDSGFIAPFEKLCSENGIKPDLKYYQSDEEARNGLIRGEVDGVLIGGMVPAGFKRLIVFSQESAYFMFRKTDTALRDDFDSAMEGILTDKPAFLSDLYQKYVTTSVDDMAPLTTGEEIFLNSKRSFSVALIDGVEPFSIKGDGKIPEGILPEYYEVLSKKLNVKFNYVFYSSTEEALSALWNGEVDIYAHYYGDAITATEDGVLVTEPYISMECGAITKSDMKGEIKKAVVTPRTLKCLNEQLGDKVELAVVDSVAEGYRAVVRGTADAYIGSVTAVTWAFNQHSLKGVKLSVIPKTYLPIAGAVSPENRDLYTAMNKAIRASGSDFISISAQCSVMNSGNIGTLFENIPSGLTIAICVIIFGLIVSLMLAVILLVRNQKAKIYVEAGRQSNEKRNEFFSGISHDMRTPLNAIIGFSDIAIETKDEKKVNEYLYKIKLSGQVLLNLINDTLMISKMQSGKMVLHPESFRLSSFLEESMVPVDAMAGENGIRIEKYFPERDYIISTDRTALQKILMNFSTNAVRYSKEDGTVWITVSVVETDERNVSLVFVVRDNGIGMSEEFMEHMFETFAQEDPQNAKKGTGLGMAIAKQFADMMDGDIKVESEVGKGSCFTVSFLLPGFIVNEEKVEKDITEKSAAVLQGEENKSDPAAEIDRILQGKRILVCEDNELNRDIEEKVLERKGMEVTMACDGKEGLETFKGSGVGHENGGFDFILMDMRMPVMDGNEATKAIRKLDRSDAKRIPIVMLSADIFSDEVERSREIGVTKYLAKPINPKAIYTTLVEVYKELE
ncbi:MAG: transporter substrate-binding domain-containing protein [Lachnospiraceae bacterium]|nr:transporter substrate-binding domain-containing protein [Lachnospiraceae bacterium]